MSNLNNNDMPTVNINTVIDKLSLVYSKAILNNIPLKKIPSVMLWGPPGVGKSQAIRQIGKEIEQSTGKKVNIVDVRLLLFNPIDLRGIPTAKEQSEIKVRYTENQFLFEEFYKINLPYYREVSKLANEQHGMIKRMFPIIPSKRKKSL